jgi:hypothetical protein
MIAWFMGLRSSGEEFLGGHPADLACPLRISIKDHHTGEGLKVELVDATGLWGERRYEIRLYGKPATKVKGATVSDISHRLRRWTVARGEPAVTSPQGREIVRR